MFINPGHSDASNPTGGFWSSVSSFMSAAAEDLEIDLEIIYSSRNHIKMIQLAEQVIARKTPPDYLIVVNEKLSAERIIRDADRAGIKTFLILNRFENEQRQRMGAPRIRYQHWIGSLIPDNQYAGYQLASSLIEKTRDAELTDRRGKIQIIGLSGDYATQASVERVEGLKLAVAEHPDVELKQVVPCDWSKEEARKKTPRLLRRYPEASIIWGANDPIAIGAAEGAASAGKKPGRDLFVGGLNWDRPALRLIENGTLETSVGGHFMIGGWALVLLYDYHHGYDFAEGKEARLKYRVFSAIHSENINRYLDKFGDQYWQRIDFTRFSKALNTNMETYNFDLENLLKPQ